MKPLSIREQVANVIVAAGQMDFDQVTAAFPHLSRRTVQKAISNARDQGLVVLESRGIGGRFGPLVPGVYRAPRAGETRGTKPKGARERVASVWQLARPPAPFALPGQPGRKYTPLGEWDAA
jgi:hypothetical protein